MKTQVFSAVVSATIVIVIGHQACGQVAADPQPLDARIEAVSRAIAADPDDPELFLQRARLNGEANRWEAMIPDLDRAIRLDPKNTGPVCERGHVYQLLGDFSRALEDLEYCQRNYPDDIQTKLSLAWVLATSPDARVRSGRRALMLAGEVCDPITCQTVEPLSALAAAYAELGEYAKAEVLQERAAAVSYFVPVLREACLRRLETIRKREPVRDAQTLLVVVPRVVQNLPREVKLDEAITAPADVLALAYLTSQNLLLLCQIAKGGATIDGWLDGQPLAVTSENAAAVERRLRERLAVYQRAITTRGHRELAAGYTSTCGGGCLDWGIDASPVLVEQMKFDAYLTQGDTRHRAVVVESTIGLMHDANTDVMITGQITDEGIVFETPQRGGVTGMAEERCRWTLSPAEVRGDEFALAFVGRAFAHRNYGDYAAMVADLDRSLELSPNAQVASAKAYTLATCADERVRDGRRAVEAAELARTLTPGELAPDVVVAAAVAYAEAGDFETAIEYQKRLIDMVPDEAKPLQREHLRRFQARKPFHEERRF
jgi:tetratricopeptide (TPR) repeat protein